MEAIWTTIQESAPALALQIARGLATFLVFWLLASVARRLLNSAFRFSSTAQRRIGAIVTSAAHTTLLIIGIVTALGTIGLDISAIVAGLGLSGFALGFALRDLVSNAVAGLMLIYDRTFDPGDRIWVTGQEGDVLAINLRYTVLQGEGRRILVPNSVLLTNAVALIREAGTHRDPFPAPPEDPPGLGPPREPRRGGQDEAERTAGRNQQPDEPQHIGNASEL